MANDLFIINFPSIIIDIYYEDDKMKRAEMAAIPRNEISYFYGKSNFEYAKSKIGFGYVYYINMKPQSTLKRILVIFTDNKRHPEFEEYIMTPRGNPLAAIACHLETIMTALHLRLPDAEPLKLSPL
jgi:hypothetical protein